MGDDEENDWHELWTVDLETATVTHVDGWAFRFTPAKGPRGVFDGEIVGQPNPLTQAHMQSAAQIARQAGEAFMDARRRRH